MDFDDDIDAYLDEELKLLDEIQEEKNCIQPFKSLHSPEEISNKRLRASSEVDNSPTNNNAKRARNGSDNEDVIPTANAPGSLSFGYQLLNAPQPISETKKNEAVRKPLDAVNQKEIRKDLLIAMDDALRKKEKEANRKKKKKSRLAEPPPDPNANNEGTPGLTDNSHALPEVTQTSVVEESTVEDDALLRDRRLKADGNVVTQMPHYTNYLSLTGQDGRRLYVTIGEREADETNITLCSANKNDGLMSEDFYVLMDEAKQLLKKQRLVEDQMNKNALTMLREDISGDEPSASKEEILWVNKYSPRSYIDLLSEENINRALLFWLKSWDKFVFGRSSTTLPESTSLSKRYTHSKAPGAKDASSKKPYLTPAQLSQAFESDASRIDPVDGRPVYKVALLSGPPGLGKTTLAHVIAKHAGYKVLEMNASDDRSADAFRTRLDAAIGSRGAVGPDGQLYPVCLIIDEIDGSPAPTIEVLVNAIKSPMNKHKSADTKKNQKKIHQPLLRPVICICNNLYSPALRNLRPLVLTVRFPEPELSRIASRLWSVTKLEGMRADMAVLTSLAEKADRDIRSCLNTLQFIHTQGKKELRKRDLDGACLGQKDAQRTLFTVWQDILSIPKPRQLLKSGRINVEDIANSKQSSSRGGTLRARFEFIHQIVMGFGETEKIVQGLFENYLDLKFKDTFMHSIVDGSEWLLFYDRLHLLVGQYQDYSLLRYTSYLPVFFHLSYATSTNAPRLQFPRLDSEALQKKTQCLSVLDCVKASPSWRSSDYSCLATEALPHLYDIIHPPGLKPMNTQLYSAKEKALLANTVDIMIDSGLTFRQERSAEGEYVYRLEPDLDTVVRFQGASVHKGQLSYAARQMIAQEINLEKMRRIEKSFKKEEKSQNVMVPASPKPNSAGLKINAGSPSSRAVSVQEQIRMSGLHSMSRKVMKDFFGRPIIEKPRDLDSSISEMNENKTPLNQKIWFKFKEGYSNAIRRPVKIRDLISN